MTESLTMSPPLENRLADSFTQTLAEAGVEAFRDLVARLVTVAMLEIEEGLVKRVCNCLLGQQAPTIYPRSETGRMLTVGCPMHDPERRKA